MEFRYQVRDKGPHGAVCVDGVGLVDLMEGEDPETKAKNFVKAARQDVAEEDIEMRRVSDDEDNFGRNAVVTSDQTANK